MEETTHSQASHSSPPAFVQDALERLLGWFGNATIVFGLCPPFDFGNIKTGVVVIADLTKEESRERLAADAPQYQFAFNSAHGTKKKVDIGYIGYGRSTKDPLDRLYIHVFHVGKHTMERLLQHRTEVLVADMRLPSFEIEYVVASLLAELERRERAYAETSGRTHKYRSSYKAALDFLSEWMRGMVRSKPDFDWMIVSKYVAENDLRSALVLFKKTIGCS